LSALDAYTIEGGKNKMDWDKGMKKEFVVRAEYEEEDNTIGMSIEGVGMNQFEKAGILMFALFSILKEYKGFEVKM